MDESLKLFRKIRHYGPLGAGKRALKRFGQHLIKVELVYQASSPVFHDREGLTFEVIRGDSYDVNDTLEQCFSDRKLVEAKDRLQSGRILVVCFIHGKPAALGWGQVQRDLYFSYVAGGLKFDRDVLYVFDCRTMMQFRGQGLFSVVLGRFVVLAGDRNCYVACRSNNTRSVRGISKAGFRLYARLYLLNLYFFRVRFSARQQV